MFTERSAEVNKTGLPFLLFSVYMKSFFFFQLQLCLIKINENGTVLSAVSQPAKGEVGKVIITFIISSSSIVVVVFSSLLFIFVILN